MPGKSNYFIGKDPAKWRTDVPTYGKVRYRDIYPGVDLVYYGNQRELEYDFLVAPGADPRRIRLAIRGARRLSLDSQGNLALQSKDGEIRLRRPHLYQQLGGERRDIGGGYALKGHDVQFEVGAYDPRRMLVIDPVLAYSTYLGGSNDDGGTGIAVDSSGNAYVTGFTISTNFPVANAIQPTFGGGNFDAFVAKINAAGNALVYSTYLGGSGEDEGAGIAVDSSGNAYVTGRTGSTDFPVANAIQPTNGGNFDAFVAKIAPTSPTTTTLNSSVNPATLGQSVTFTATVNSSGGTPTGSVTFSDGTTTLGTVTLSSGQAALNTSSLAVGSHTITAQYNPDTANFVASSTTLTETVTYGICALYDQTRSVKSGAVDPIKVALCDVNGNDVSSSAVVLHATAVMMGSVFVGTPDDAGNANPDNDFRFDSTLGTTGGYIFNLSTSGLASGTYSLQFTATGDPVNSVNFGVK